MDATQCFLIRTLQTTLKFTSKDLEKYQGAKVLIDESVLTNKHQTKVSKNDKTLRLKIESRSPIDGSVVSPCTKETCIKQRSKRFDTGKKGIEKMAEPNQFLYLARESEAEAVIVEKDNSITIKVRSDCCSNEEHVDLPFIIFFVELLDQTNHAVLRGAFYSKVKANQRSAAPTRFCEVSLNAVAQ